MTSATQPMVLVPPVRVAIDRFLARSRFAARTRDIDVQIKNETLRAASTLNQPP